MPVFVEDPTLLSKSRLKSDLIAHNIELPPAECKKEVFLELHLKHIDPKNAADFSSDEEDHEGNEVEEEDPKMLDSSGLTDNELKAKLLKHGVKAGPINASTRPMYERKLKKLLEPDAQPKVNGKADAALYSDSEDDEMEGEDKEEEESDSEQETQETVSNMKRSQQESSKAELKVQNGGYFYHRCFLPSSRLRVPTPIPWEPCPKRNAGNVVESPAVWGPPQIPTELSRTFSVDLPTGLGSGMESRNTPPSLADRERKWNGSHLQEHRAKSRWLEPLKVDKHTMMDQSMPHTPNPSPYKPKIKPPQEEQVTDFLTEMFPEARPKPTGMSATCRRPIKGAAGRPVQYKYPDTPFSPVTREMREIERHLVPVYVQVLVFLIVACLLYIIYACVEDISSNPLVAFLDNLSQETDEEQLLQAETGDGSVLN